MADTFFVNLKDHDSLELQLLGSLREKSGLSILGSSELTSESDYIPYQFFPDSVGVRLNAFGHAYHQSFAMFCQLLALKKELKDAKICILLSPGWFETEGTNVESFLEFARPNFMAKIIRDGSISLEYKYKIASYLEKNNESISNPNTSINYFLKLKKYKDFPYMDKFFYERLDEFPKIRYHLKPEVKTAKPQIKHINWEDSKIRVQKKFLAGSKSNQLFVNDAYFFKNLKRQDGTIRTGEYLSLPKEKSQELEDFKLLVKLLKQEQADVSFVIQPLNPYFYNQEALKSFEPVLKKIKRVLDKEQIPYLNLFTIKKEEYKPGRLDDVMHLGDLGWLEVNQFLYQTYYEK